MDVTHDAGPDTARPTTPPPPARAPEPAPAGPGLLGAHHVPGAPGASRRSRGRTSRPRTVLALSAVAAVAVPSALVGAGIGVLLTRTDGTGGGPAAAVAPAAQRGSGVGGSAVDVHRVLAAVEPAVVTVRTRSTGLDSLLQPVAERGTGTGVVVSPDGLIVTNDHVVDKAPRITVQLQSGRTLPAKVLGTAPGSDLAVVKVHARGLPVARLGDSDSVRVGDPVVAIGNALGLPGGPTVTQGIVSARGRSIAEPNGVHLDNVLQTDAAINPGNSGGPLVNARGRVVGINSATSTQGQDIGFAIAITPARQVIGRLEAGHTIGTPFLGVQVVDVTRQVKAEFGLPTDSGALVVATTPASPAEGAGLVPGTVITAIDGTPVTRASDVHAALSGHEPGDRVLLTVARPGGTSTSVALALGVRAG